MQADKDSFRLNVKKVFRNSYGLDNIDALDEAYEEQFKEHQEKQQLTRDMDEARAEAASIAAKTEAAARARAEAAARARAEAAAKAEAAAEAKRKQQEATAKVGKIDTPTTKRDPTNNLEALVQKKPRDAGTLEELVVKAKQERAKKAKAAGKKRQKDMKAAEEPVEVDLSYLKLPRGVKRNEVYELAEEKEEGPANKKLVYDGNITSL